MTPLLAAVRTWWWKRAHAKFYASPESARNVYALNVGTEERFHRLVRELRERLAPQADDRVLDLGGGNGRLSSEVFRGCRQVIVLDVCRPPDAMGRFIVADMTQPPFRDGVFTRLFTYSTFPHIGSEAAACRALAVWDALLAPGGVLFVGDVPERRRLSAVLGRGVPRLRGLNGLRYFFAVSMAAYFSRRRLRTCLERLGYDVQTMDQSPDRRFHRERFDLLARKGPALVGALR